MADRKRRVRYRELFAEGYLYDLEAWDRVCDRMWTRERPLAQQWVDDLDDGAMYDDGDEEWLQSVPGAYTRLQ